MDYSTPIQPVMVESSGGLNNLWNNPFIYLIFFLFFGRGFGALGGGVDQQLSNDFLYSNLSAGQRQLENQMQSMGTNLGNGLCAIQYENAQQFGALKAEMASCCCETQKGIMQSTYDITNQMNAGFNGVDKAICSLGYELNNSIHNEGEITRALINANTMQDLRDRLQASELVLANANQTQTLLSQLNSIYCKIPQQPVPAYVVPFPPQGIC